MANNSDEIQVVKGEVTGYAFTAAYGTTLPTSPTDTLATGFNGIGYMGEDGIVVAQDKGTDDVKDMNQEVVKKLQNKSETTFKVTLLESNIHALRERFGQDNVSDNATTKIRETLISNGQLPARSWVFKTVTDRDLKQIMIMPKAQVTEVGDIKIAAGGVKQYELTLVAYPYAPYDGCVGKISEQLPATTSNDKSSVKEVSVDEKVTTARSK